MSKETVKTQIDTDITNKTTAKSISPSNVGSNMKAVVDLIPGGFRELKGTISQSGSNNPTIVIFNNDFVGTITNIRVTAGTYTLSISGLLSTDYLDKSFCLIGSSNNPISNRNEMLVGTDGGGNYYFTIYTLSVPTNIPTDSLLTKTSFQIIIKD